MAYAIGMRASIVAIVVLGGLASALARPVLPLPHRRLTNTDELAARVVEAIHAHDATAVRGLLADVVMHDALWFADRACTRRFGKPGTADKAAVPMLARCLAKQRAIATTRRTALVSGAVLTFEPGIEIEVQFERERVRWLGKPRLTAQAFEALRARGSLQLDDALAGKLTAPATAWLEICLERTGAIASKRVVEAQPAMAADAFLAATGDWQFRAFAPRKQATPICALALLAYPATSAPSTEVLPASQTPVPMSAHVLETVGNFDFGDVTFAVPSMRVTPAALEAQRLLGSAKIEPDAATKHAMLRAKTTRVTAAFELCVDTNGRPDSVRRLKSSGFTAYDQQLERDMRRWRFRPYVIRGTARRVCTTSAFDFRP